MKSMSQPVIGILFGLAAIAAPAHGQVAHGMSAADYAAPFSSEQWARLNTIFPAGVCDWSLPGVEQQGLIGTWVFFD